MVYRDHEAMAIREAASENGEILVQQPDKLTTVLVYGANQSLQT